MVVRHRDPLRAEGHGHGVQRASVADHQHRRQVVRPSEIRDVDEGMEVDEGSGRGNLRARWSDIVEDGLPAAG